MSIRPQQMEMFEASQTAERLGDSVRLLEIILEHRNMFRALNQVRANKGAPGIDKISAGKIGGYLRRGYGNAGTLIRFKRVVPSWKLTFLISRTALVSDPYAGWCGLNITHKYHSNNPMDHPFFLPNSLQVLLSIELPWQ